MKKPIDRIKSSASSKLSLCQVRAQIKYKFSLTALLLTSLCYGAFECVYSLVTEKESIKLSEPIDCNVSIISNNNDHLK